MKARTGTIKDFIREETKKNNGHPPKLIGANGYRMELTVENFNKLNAICSERHKEYEGKNCKISRLHQRKNLRK